MRRDLPLSAALWAATTLSIGTPASAGSRGVLSDQSAPAGLDQAYAPRRVALVVGIDTYADEALGDLRFAAKDAHDMAGVLTDPTAGDFDVVSELSGEVSRAAFWNALSSITATLHRDDTFLIYVAAHGTLDLSEGTELYLMPSDGRLANISETGIALSELEQALSRVPARRRVLALDSCHTGQGRSRISAQDQQRLASFRGPVPPPVAATVSQSEVRLYSAHLNQPALEDEQLGNGVYTHYLVEALAGSGDLDGDGLVEAIEAHNWARDMTLEFTGGTQVPWMETQLVGREAVYLAGDPGQRKDAERAIITGLEALPARAVITVDGTVRGAEAIEPGRRGVRIELDGEPLVDRPLRVRAGNEVDVGGLVRERSKHLDLDLGGDMRADDTWIPTLGPRVGVWFQPADPRGGRLALGVAASYGAGALPAGQFLARAGWWWGAGVQLGPTLSAGWLWRIAPTTLTAATDSSLLSEDQKEAQGTGVIAPGLTVRGFVRGRLLWSLEPNLGLFSTVGGMATMPAISASVGVRL